jgi:putative hemolysin
LDDSESRLLLINLLLLIVIAILSTIETALTFTHRSRLKQLVAEGSSSAQSLSDLIYAPQDIITIVVIWHRLLIFTVGALSSCWVLCSPKATPPLAIGLFLFFTAFIFMAEIFPWKMVPGNAENISMKFISFLTFMHRCSSPCIKFFLFLGSPIIRGSGEQSASKSKVTEDEIRMMVEEASSQGVLAEEEKDMIHSVIELSDTIAKEIMIPRLDIVAVEVNTPLNKVLDTAITHGLSRLPVFEETVDKVIGIVHTKDLLSLLREKKMDTQLKEIIRHAYFTPGSKKIDEMLREMQREKVAMAIVVDEYGGTDGLVTIEDIIEEIVGDITDEYDKEINPIELMDDGSYIVDAKTIIEDVNDQIGIDLPTDEFETIAGYIYGLTGHIPHNGETINTDSITITVEKVIRQRISKIKIQKTVKEAATAENA